MLPANLDEHADDDAVEPGQLDGHAAKRSPAAGMPRRAVFGLYLSTPAWAAALSDVPVRGESATDVELGRAA